MKKELTVRSEREKPNQKSQKTDFDQSWGDWIANGAKKKRRTERKLAAGMEKSWSKNGKNRLKRGGIKSIQGSIQALSIVSGGKVQSMA